MDLDEKWSVERIYERFRERVANHLVSSEGSREWVLGALERETRKFNPEIFE